MYVWQSSFGGSICVKEAGASSGVSGAAQIYSIRRYLHVGNSARPKQAS